MYSWAAHVSISQREVWGYEAVTLLLTVSSSLLLAQSFPLQSLACLQSRHSASVGCVRRELPCGLQVLSKCRLQPLFQVNPSWGICSMLESLHHLPPDWHHCEPT